MKILLVGGDGRADVFAQSLAAEKGIKVIGAPGNAGIRTRVECRDIRVDDIDGLVKLAGERKVDCALISPELPLSLGIADRLAQIHKIPTIGPGIAGAWLEISKVFAKEFMVRNKIPTARYKVCVDAEEALKFAKENRWARVVKEDGLAEGKGVVVAKTLAEARAAIRKFMVEKIHGNAGDRLVLEECLDGIERSFIVLVDDETVITTIPAKDYKRRFDGDKGKNTGGIGCVGSQQLLTAQEYRQIMQEIVWPTIEGLRREGIPYRGFLYFGLMFTADGIFLIEYNVRMGDPEASVIIPILASPLSELLWACATNKLRDCKPQWLNENAVCVVAVSGGYPDAYETGFEIKGLAQAIESGALIFHAGTTGTTGEPFRTIGGRVLEIVGKGQSIPSAASVAYTGIGKISFKGMDYRRDIALDVI